MTGLNDIPADERPPANTMLHLAFDAMVGIGSALLLLGLWLAWSLVETARHPADPVVPADRSRSPGAAAILAPCGAGGS